MKRLKKDPTIPFLLVSKKEELNTLPTARSGENVFISVGNIVEKKENYNIIALNNWQHIPLENEQLVGNVVVNPGERKVFEYKLPQVKDNSNFRLLLYRNLMKLARVTTKAQPPSGHFEQLSNLKY